MFLSGRLYPPYFQKGIRIYSKTYICGSMVQVPVEEVALCEAFKRRLLPSLVFEEIGPGEFDFRGKVFQFSLLSYSQIIHGYLKIDRDSGIIRVVGFLYWGILAFVLSLFNDVSLHFFLHANFSFDTWRALFYPESPVRQGRQICL